MLRCSLKHSAVLLCSVPTDSHTQYYLTKGLLAIFSPSLQGIILLSEGYHRSQVSNFLPSMSVTVPGDFASLKRILCILILEDLASIFQQYQRNNNTEKPWCHFSVPAMPCRVRLHSALHPSSVVITINKLNEQFCFQDHKYNPKRSPL